MKDFLYLRMASKHVKALKNSSKYEIDCCICLVVTYLKMEYFGCKVDFASDGISYSASLLVVVSKYSYMQVIFR